MSVRTGLALLLATACALGLHAAQTSPPVPEFPAMRDEAADLLRRLIRIDTSNPPGNESNAAALIKGALDKEGIASRLYTLQPNRGSIVARLKGNGRQRPLLLMGHTDVVGVEREKW